MRNYPTFAAARRAGYRVCKPWEYGGKQITVKGRVLVCGPDEAHSPTEWSRRGYRVRAGQQPHATRSGRVGGKRQVWDVYRKDQVRPKGKWTPRPPRQIPILAAIWVLNQRAKRCRDLARHHYDAERFGFATSARREKVRLYELKGQALHHLVESGELKVIGHHQFPDGQWAEVLQGGGYTFHRPCPTQPGTAGAQIDHIEAKPRGAKDPKLKDALLTANSFLAAKPRAHVFSWPPRVGPPAGVRIRIP